MKFEGDELYDQLPEIMAGTTDAAPAFDRYIGMQSVYLGMMAPNCVPRRGP